MIFELHPRLAADCIALGDLTLCRVLLMNNSLYPWLVLVPMRPGLRELFDLEDADYRIACAEIRAVSTALARHCQADKMNIAALGNQVPQLHIHIIARFHNDNAWPQPVWSASASQPYAQETLTQMAEKLKQLLGFV